MTATCAAVIGIDGGNSKTEVLVASPDGTVLARRLGPTSSPHLVGLEGTIVTLRAMLADALGDVALSLAAPLAIATCLAGLDLPEEEDEARAALSTMAPQSQHVVANDTFAVLRAGLDGGSEGVAVVCGAGINAVGVGPAGTARFLALGALSGDWGGGFGIGEAALGAAVRFEEGRGPMTSLTTAIAASFGFARAADVTVAIHRRELPSARLAELAPLVVQHARAGDALAAQLVDRCAAEVASFADAALTRSGLAGAPAHVVLGGSMLAGIDQLIGEMARRHIEAVHPAAQVRFLVAPPVVGALAMAFDQLGVVPVRDGWPGLR